ncbi:hydroxyacid-oxoacid transhydrogenase, mitochondrial-like [Argonauta hians]
MARFLSGREKVSQLMRLVSSKWNNHSPDFAPPISFHHHGTPPTAKEYAFEMSCSSVRYGEGVTQEVGKDFRNLGSKNICVMTDKNVLKTNAAKVALQSLEDQNLNYKLFTDIKVEPSDESFKVAIDFVKKHDFDAFLAVGGGSTMDTCKAANLYASDPSAEFLDYVNAPIGKGLPITVSVKPLIAIPTTTGTGSETTGTSVFGLEKLNAKTGISNRSLRPTLGILDPLNVMSQPERVVAYSGLDVLCHALESYTALPFNERVPRASSPELRPAYQGSNPVSDVWSQAALEVCDKYLQRAVDNQDDCEAMSNLQLASSFAAVGFGNAGVHLCHAISYPIAGLVRNFKSEGYPTEQAIIPHGLSVIITSPAVFNATARACPQRHLNGARFLGVDISNKKAEDAGAIISDRLRSICQSLRVPNGLKALGYTEEDIPAIVKGTLPQHRVTKLSPLQQSDEELAETLKEIIKNSMTLY